MRGINPESSLTCGTIKMDDLVAQFGFWKCLKTQVQKTLSISRHSQGVLLHFRGAPRKPPSLCLVTCVREEAWRLP